MGKKKALCQRCGSDRMLEFGTHCRDQFEQVMLGKNYYGYGIGPFGSGDSLHASVCMDCGQAKGTWPCVNPFEGDEE